MKSVLYITFSDLADVSSGSGVRPAAMYQAFLERGYTVKLLSGGCGRHQGKSRRAAVKEIECWLQNNRPDFCYIESSTYPIFYRCDYTLIYRIACMKIPVAYFYRDFYRKFPDLFPRRTDLMGRLKDLYLDFLQWRTDRLLRCVDIVYLPSDRCKKLFSYKRMEALPPAGENRIVEKTENRKTCIYVGGVSFRYGIQTIMESFRILNKNAEPQGQYRLILVCREREYKDYQQEIGQYPWLEIHHASGEQLIPLYRRADVGLIALHHDAYGELAVGIKLFQYFSFGLPVVSTDVAAMKSLILGAKAGVVAKETPLDFAKAIRSILDDDTVLETYCENVRKSLLAEHLWVHRVDQIERDLRPACRTQLQRPN